MYSHMGDIKTYIYIYIFWTLRRTNLFLIYENLCLVSTLNRDAMTS